MAWTYQGQIGTAANQTANQTSLVATTTATANAGDVLVLMVAKDNTVNVSGATASEVHQVGDSAGNVWNYGFGYSNAGTAQASTCVSLWFSLLTSQLVSGGTVTALLGVPGQSASNDAQAMIVERFSLSAGSYVSKIYAGGDEGDVADPAALVVSSLPNIAALWLHALAFEGPVSDAFTWDSDYTQFTAAGTSDATDTNNQTITGGYRIQTATGDTIDVTSDTADRDYAQIVVVLAEVIPKAQSMASNLINPAGLVG